MHKMSSGKPYPPDGDLGEFAPKGEPKSVQKMGKGSPKDNLGGGGTKNLHMEDETPDSADEALAEFAPIAKASSSSSIKASTKIPISLESDGLAVSVYNRPGGRGGTAD